MSDRELFFPLLEQSVDRLVTLTSSTSTNTEIKNFLESDGTIAVITDDQTDGRGRLGRQWVSRPGESIALSIAFPWSASDQERSGSWVPLIVGSCLVRSLMDHGLDAASLKWPNDLVVGEKKLAGILCEWVPAGWMIVGVGINVDFFPDSPPSPRGTALAHHVASAVSVLDSVLAGLVLAVRAWVDDARDGATQGNILRVSSVMSTLGRLVEVQEPSGETWSGEAHGLDASGHLLVMPDGGSELRVVVASDIEHLYQ